MQIKVTVLALSLLGSLAAHAGDVCLQNFTREGDVARGQIYKTWESFPSVNPEDAYARAYAFTIEHGFTVNSADKSIGVISASQTVPNGNGTTVPLNIVVRNEQGGSNVSIVYATYAGAVSPEDAIKKHFCATMAAVVQR